MPAKNAHCVGRLSRLRPCSQCVEQDPRGRMERVNKSAQESSCTSLDPYSPMRPRVDAEAGSNDAAEGQEGSKRKKRKGKLIGARALTKVGRAEGRV